MPNLAYETILRVPDLEGVASRPRTGLFPVAVEVKMRALVEILRLSTAKAPLGWLQHGPPSLPVRLGGVQEMRFLGLSRDSRHMPGQEFGKNAPGDCLLKAQVCASDFQISGSTPAYYPD